MWREKLKFISYSRIEICIRIRMDRKTKDIKMRLDNKDYNDSEWICSLKYKDAVRQ